MNWDIVELDVVVLFGFNVEKWVEFYYEYVVFSEYFYEFVWDVIVEVDGLFVIDVDGNVFLDFICYIGVVLFGYNNEKVLLKFWEFDFVELMKIVG